MTHEQYRAFSGRTDESAIPLTGELAEFLDIRDDEDLDQYRKVAGRVAAEQEH
jgi:hypothetical protein